MEPAKKLRWYVVFQSACLALLALGAYKNALPPFLLLAVALCNLGGLLLLCGFVLMPLIKLERQLEKCIRSDSAQTHMLSHLSGDTAYARMIKLAVAQLAAREIRDSNAEMFDRQAELRALQSQINPHFLYNTLESIRAQALLDDNDEVAKMVEALASFFRYSISRKGNLVTLRDELANIKNYIVIQRYRFNNRFSLEIDIDEEDEVAYDYLIPRLIIQPVVENSIYHGLEDMMEGGKVTIEVIVTDCKLVLTISDNGKGMDGRALRELNEKIHAGDLYAGNANAKNVHTGIALPNIHKRIQLLFGGQYGLNVYSTPGQGTDVEITVPAQHERSAHET